MSDDFDECVASGQSCSYRPHGPEGEMQCQYCGAAPPYHNVLPIETIRYHVMVACRDNWDAISLARVLEHAVVAEMDRRLRAERAVVQAAATSRPMDERERQFLDGVVFGIETMEVYTRGARSHSPAPEIQLPDAIKP